MQNLNRNDMKMIVAGTTNCQICDDGTMEYKEFDGSAPPEGCAWGTCPVPDEK